MLVAAKWTPRTHIRRPDHKLASRRLHNTCATQSFNLWCHDRDANRFTAAGLEVRLACCRIHRRGGEPPAAQPLQILKINMNSMEGGTEELAAAVEAATRASSSASLKTRPTSQ